MAYVVFVPGFKGSQLVTANREIIWPPNLYECIWGMSDEKIRILKYSKLYATEVIESLKIFNTSVISVYDEFLKKLCKKFKKDRVILFPYDWRISIENTVDLLLQYLKLTIPRNCYFYLLGHSMGGMIVTNMLKYKSDPFIKNNLLGICTLGSPILGTFRAFTILFNLEDVGNGLKNIFRNIHISEIICNFQSVYEMIPYGVLKKHVLLNASDDMSLLEFLMAVECRLKSRLKTTPQLRRFVEGNKFYSKFQERMNDNNHEIRRFNISVMGKSQLQIVDLRDKNQISVWYDYTNSDGIMNNSSKPNKMVSQKQNLIDEDLHTDIYKNDFTFDLVDNEIQNCLRYKISCNHVVNDVFYLHGRCPKLSHYTETIIKTIEKHKGNYKYVVSVSKFNDNRIKKYEITILHRTPYLVLKFVEIYTKQGQKISSANNICKSNFNISQITFFSTEKKPVLQKCICIFIRVKI